MPGSTENVPHRALYNAILYRSTLFGHAHINCHRVLELLLSICLHTDHVLIAIDFVG